MDKKITFSPYVMLIDASYINKVGIGLADYFSKQMGRALPKADLPLLLECMAMDAGIQPGDNEVQFFFVSDGHMTGMKFCLPSRLADEIHGNAFRGPVGEFSLYAFQPSGLATVEELFMETLQLIDEAKEVLRIVMVPDEDTYGHLAWQYADGMQGDKVVAFGMKPLETGKRFRFETLGYPLLKSYGIRPDDL